MKTYAEAKNYVTQILADVGMADVRVYPGPDLPNIPDRFVVLTPYGGPGLDLDGALDQRSWQVRSCGRQGDYESAEEVATAIDIAFLSHVSSSVGSTWVPQIQRVGGAPTPLGKDDAERTQFVCSYIVDCSIALAN